MRIFSLVSCLLVSWLTIGCTGGIGSNSARNAGEGGSNQGGNAAGEPGGSAGTAPKEIDMTDPVLLGSEDPTCDASEINVGNGVWRRLTQRQYRNTVKDLLGIDPDTSSFLNDSTTGSFATNTQPPQSKDVNAYSVAAEAIASKVTLDLPKLLGCAAITEACAQKFIRDFGSRAYRHELSTAEYNGLLETFNLGKSDGMAHGIGMVLQVILQSPSFLYLTEFGTTSDGDVSRLSSREVANRISYLLWNTTPDADLLAAAADGRLDGIEGIESESRRLMADPRFASALGEFFAQLLHANKLTDSDVVQKSAVPEFDGAMRQAMLAEVRAFVSDALQHDEASVKTLFTASRAFPTGPLLKTYNTTASALTNGRLDLVAGRRSGLLTSPALMAAEPPTPTPYGAVQRGKFVRVALMCDELPPPPANLMFVTPSDAATTPQRTLLEEHRENPTCIGCHSLMDPIGFGLENFDSIGRYRERYPKGEIIDSSGEILGDTDIDGPFQNAAGLAAKLAESKKVRNCLSTQWFRFSQGREPSAADTCATRAFVGAMAEGDGDLPTAVLRFVTSNAFRFRKGVQP
jgi:Protein of unknown function (DUF1592)/Protein of unknown function (DUF1588)/Protein of unknown function (DUF1595)/Protein of unknown function (DUF1585)/Protein of unknown function (DUF1587)